MAQTTAVDFHSGVADKLAYACRLLRKALRGGQPVVVTGKPGDLNRLDQLLWTFEPGEFLPHARWKAGQAPPDRLARTPLWLADQPGDTGLDQVLVNLGPEAAPQAAHFTRVIELVGEDPDEVAAARARWRHYRAEGLTPTNHDQRGAV